LMLGSTTASMNLLIKVDFPVRTAPTTPRYISPPVLSAMSLKISTFSNAYPSYTLVHSTGLVTIYVLGERLYHFYQAYSLLRYQLSVLTRAINMIYVATSEDIRIHHKKKPHSSEWDSQRDDA